VSEEIPIDRLAWAFAARERSQRLMLAHYEFGQQKSDSVALTQISGEAEDQPLPSGRRGLGHAAVLGASGVRPGFGLHYGVDEE
jgi:hypothetical protein